MRILELTGYYIGLLYITWVLFLAVMNIKNAKDAGILPKATYIIAYPMYLVALGFDFILNMASSIIFLEFPRELLLTSRCERHLAEYDGWRFKLAKTICVYLLDPFERGGHCHTE